MENKTNQQHDTFFYPDDILTSKDKLQMICTNISEKLNKNKLFLALLSTLIAIFLAIASAIMSNKNIMLDSVAVFSKDSTNAEILAAVIFLGLVLSFFIILFILASLIKHYKSVDIFNELIYHTSFQSEYTGIILIVDASTNDKLYLIGNEESQSGKNYLPYISYSPNDSDDNFRNKICARLKKDYSIKEHEVLNIEKLKEDMLFGIKKSSNHKYKQYGYMFICVKLKETVKFRINRNKHFKLMSLKQMLNDTNSMRANKDVIEFLQQYENSVKDSFKKNNEFLKVIWNITDKCGHNCDICATHDVNRKEVDLKNKIIILRNLLENKEIINHIDFAGGDPLVSDDSIEVIQLAGLILGNSKISITTTGNGLNKQAEYIQQMTNHQYEITLDIAEETNLCKITRNDNKYNESNIKQCYEVLYDNNNGLVVNMPIIQHDITKKSLENIFKKIKELKVKLKISKIYIKLIRLMPVGKMSIDYPKDYNPIQAINSFKNIISNSTIDVECSLHCSLKASKTISKDNPVSCQMLETKIGIDCKGNVFACAWAGYLLEKNTQKCFNDIAKNPFYIGNLTSNTLSEIFNGKKYIALKSVISKNEMFFCPIISYYNTGKWNEGQDPIA